MLLHHNNAKNHYELYGRAYADPENFSWGGERVEGIFMFPGGGLRHIFGKFKKFGVFFAPSPTRLSRFPHGRAILSASRNNPYT